AADRMAGIYELIGQSDKVKAILDRKTEMQKAILADGWDGEWFLRAYDARSQKVGSKECDEGKIFIESQGWCVLGGVGLDDGKARLALDSVKKRLATPNGIILQQPAYTTYH